MGSGLLSWATPPCGIFRSLAETIALAHVRAGLDQDGGDLGATCPVTRVAVAITVLPIRVGAESQEDLDSLRMVAVDRGRERRPAVDPSRVVHLVCCEKRQDVLKPRHISLFGCFPEVAAHLQSPRQSAVLLDLPEGPSTPHGPFATLAWGEVSSVVLSLLCF